MKSFFILSFLTVFTVVSALAQSFEIGGQIRPRAEYKHGYRSLIGDDVKPAFAISQRTRLNMNYNSTLFNTGISIQDVRTWGDAASANKTDVNGLMVHQAWGELFIKQKFSIKAGRQTIIYDDQRIFGNSDWNQQGRSHDALLLKYTQSKTTMIHAGFAYNQNTEKDTGNFYSLNYFKAVQYLWAHHEIKNVAISFLVGNFGMPYNTVANDKSTQEIKYIQTIGPYISYKKGNLKLNLAGYYQMGKNTKNMAKKAWYTGGDVTYLVKQFSVGAGFQYFTGNDQVNPDSKDHEFTVGLGTGHKFNGWMDYFYAGSPHKGVGLLDLYIPVIYKKDKITSEFQLHYYQSAADVKDLENPTSAMNSRLGTEVGIMMTYAISPEMNISGGYSQMFGTETLQAIKGGNYKNTQNWAWVMFTFNPTFFTSKK